VTDDKQQLTIWGRANSVNVQKVLWCLRELDLSYRRIDAGMQFGKNDQAEYLAMNPTAGCRRWSMAISYCGNPIR
jgi:glutathione S-transferase